MSHTTKAPFSEADNARSLLFCEWAEFGVIKADYGFRLTIGKMGVSGEGRVTKDRVLVESYDMEANIARKKCASEAGFFGKGCTVEAVVFAKGRAVEAGGFARVCQPVVESFVFSLGCPACASPLLVGGGGRR